MAESFTERDSIDSLADEFLERHRKGEWPSVEEYAAAHPALAAEIRDLFPTMAELEGFKSRRAHSDGMLGSASAPKIEQLADFRIIREIGRGGMGIVYEAEQESLGRRVAVKVLPRQALLKPKQLARFQREARTAARLHHTHIVPVFGVGEADGHHFIVMQLITGVGLDEVLHELRRLDGNGEKQHDETTPARPGRPASHVARSLLSGLSTDSPATLVAGTSATDLDFSDTARTSDDNAAAVGDVTMRMGFPPDENRSDSTTAISGDQLGKSYWQNIARIGRDAADALAYAHSAGTLHRDIKPGNLLVDVRGEVWVADFGLAKASEGEQVSQTGDVVGTLRYMAPEQFRDATDVRSDVYSLGLTLYEMVTLTPAFDQQACHRAVVQNGHFGELARPSRAVGHLPRDLETIILTASAAEPGHRYQNAAELAADLNRFLEDRPIHVRRVRWYEQLWRWGRRNRSVAALSALAVFLLVAVAAVSSTGYYRTEKARTLAEQRLTDERVQRQRADEQRERAEGTLTISLDALDAVYRRFAPERFSVTKSVSLQDGEEEQTVSAEPVLAPEHAKFLQEILVFYDRLAEHSGGSVLLREEAAKANRRIGDIHHRLGNSSLAQIAYKRSAEKYETLLAEAKSPDDTHRLELELARIDNHLGEAARGSWDPQESSKAFDSARKRLESLTTKTDASNVKFELARTYYLLAVRPFEVGAGRGPPGGVRGFSRNGMAKQKLPFGNGGRFGGRRGEGGPGRNGFTRSGRKPPTGRGRSPRPFGEFPRSGRAAGVLDMAVKILDELHVAHPKDANYQHWLAIVLRERNDNSDSDDHTKAVDLLEDLTRRFPQATDFQYSLVETWARGSDPRRQHTEEEIQIVENRLRKALTLIEILSARQANVPAYALSHASVAHRLAMTLEHRSRRDESSKLTQSKLTSEIAALHATADEVQAALSERHPQIVPYAIWWAKFRSSRVFFLIGRGRLDEAKTLLEAMAAISKRIPVEHLASRFVQGGRHFAYLELAEAFRKSGNTAEARKASETAKLLPHRPDGRSRGRGRSRFQR